MRRFAVAIVLLACMALPAGAAGPDSNLAANDNGGGCYPQPLTGDLLSMLSLVNPEWAPITGTSTGLCSGGINDGKSCTTDSDCTDPSCTSNCPVCVPIGAPPVLMHGTVASVHGQIGGDFPATHVTSDMVAELNLDAADADRVATGNGPQNSNNLALEWEAGSIPAFAWPGEGDRVVALGRWIFDCGHPDAIPGTCSTTTSQACVSNVDCTTGCPSCVAGETCTGVTYGYSSEIHPPYAIASIRQGNGGTFSRRDNARMYPVTRADVYISPDAGGAGDRCILTHAASYNDLLNFNHQCYPLSEPISLAAGSGTPPINSQDFVFDIPLPPRPATGGHLRRKIIHHDRRRDLPVGFRRAHVRFKKFLDAPQPYVEATVKLTARSHPNYLAESIIFGWTRDTTPLTHVRVTLQSLVVNNPVRPLTPVSPKTCSSSTTTPCNTAADCPAGEYCWGIGTVKGWYMDAEVNGNWQSFTNLDDVNAGDEIAENLVYDAYLPAGGQLHIAAKGQSKECIDAMYGKSLATDLNEQGLAKGSNCILSAPRPIGTLDETYTGPDFGAGSSGSTDYNVQSVGGDGGHCSGTTSTLCVGDADCPTGQTCVVTGGAFNLKYRIEKIVP